MEENKKITDDYRFKYNPYQKVEMCQKTSSHKMDTLKKKIRINLVMLILSSFLFVYLILFYRLYALFVPAVGFTILSIYVYYQLETLNHRVL